MIFRPELAAMVVAGEKTVTRRIANDNPRSPWFRGKCGYRVGQVFTINPGRGVANIGSAVVTSAVRMRLGHLTDAEARREGCADAADFERTWKQINGAYDPSTVVWRIAMEPVPSNFRTASYRP